MALLNCKECSGRVSSEAQSCPHCGLPRTDQKTIAQPRQTGAPEAAVTLQSTATINRAPAAVRPRKRHSSLLIAVVAASFLGLFWFFVKTAGAPKSTYIGSLPAFTIMTRDAGKIRVRLSNWASAEQLGKIAVNLHSSLDGSDQLTFFYLPLSFGDSPDAPWARVKFTPKPVVTIYGFTPESLAESTALASQVPERIGAWMFNYGGGSEVIVISQRGQSLRRTDLIVGGKSIEYGADLHETQTSTGRLFRGPDLSKTGDSWLLKPNGDLVVADNDGVISIARPIRF